MARILGFFRNRKRNNDIPEMELFVDIEDYEQLRNHAVADGISENAEFVQRLRKGMNDLWLHVAKFEKERYHIVEKLFEQSKRDNEVLEALVKQNISFREILEDNPDSQDESGMEQ